MQLRELGHKVVLVSSGAIGVGLKRMEMASKPKSLSGKQVSALIRPIYAAISWWVGPGRHRARQVNCVMG